MRKTLLIILTFALSMGAYAMQPDYQNVDIRVENISPNVIKLLVSNLQKEDLTLLLTNGKNGNITFENQTIKLTRNETKQINLLINLAKARFQFLNIEAKAYDQDKTVLAVTPIFKTLTIENNKLKEVPLTTAIKANQFIINDPSTPEKINIGADLVKEVDVVRQIFKSEKLPENIKVQNLTDLQLPALLKLRLRQLPESRNVESSVGSDRNSGTRIPGRDIVLPRPMSENISSAIKFDEKVDYQIKGKITFRDGTDFYSAWGWVVNAWQKKNGNWRFLGWTYASGNGDWSILINKPFFSKNDDVLVQYVSANRFVEILQDNGKPYAWGDTWRFGQSNTLDIGSRFADLSVNANLPGMHSLYKGATYFWTRFYEAGINPLRPNSIKVTYPNTLATGKCTNTDSAGNTIAWSCSYSTNGEIYIAAQHANVSVTQHEIGHSVHHHFWGSFPTGAGGQHNIGNCYNGGLAITEGFANFLPFWIQRGPRDAADVDGFNFNLETLPTTYCTGDTNEARVAATLWDLYDVWNDGTGEDRDTMLFTNQGYTVAKFLSIKKNNMSEFRTVYHTGLSQEWKDKVDAIFRLNTTN